MKMNPKNWKRLISKARREVHQLEKRFVDEHAEFEQGELALYSFSDRFKDQIVAIKDVYIDVDCRIVYQVQEMVKGGYREKKNVGPYPVWQESNELFKLKSEQKEG